MVISQKPSNLGSVIDLRNLSYLTGAASCNKDPCGTQDQFLDCSKLGNASELFIS